MPHEVPPETSVTPSVTPWRQKDARALARWFLEADLSDARSLKRLCDLTGRTLAYDPVADRGEVRIQLRDDGRAVTYGLVWASSRKDAAVIADEARQRGERVRFARTVLPTGREYGRWRLTRPISRRRLVAWYARWQELLRSVLPLPAEADAALTGFERRALLSRHRNEPVADAESALMRAELRAGEAFDLVAQLAQDVHLDIARSASLAPFPRHRSVIRARPRRLELTSSTLMGEIALGLYNELLARRGTALCEECRRPFSRKRSDKRFCSDRCRKRAHPDATNAERQRRFRVAKRPRRPAKSQRPSASRAR
jgi:hypothetical protein